MEPCKTERALVRSLHQLIALGAGLFFAVLYLEYLK